MSLPPWSGMVSHLFFWSTKEKQNPKAQTNLFPPSQTALLHGEAQQSFLEAAHGERSRPFSLVRPLCSLRACNTTAPKSNAKPLRKTDLSCDITQPATRVLTHKTLSVVPPAKSSALSATRCLPVNPALTGPTQEHPWSGCERRKRQLSVRGAVRWRDDAAEEPGALPNGTKHRWWSVGGELVRPVQQMISKDAGRAKLTLVQHGTGVGHAEVEGRRRYEERFRSVPILLLVLQWF